MSAQFGRWNIDGREVDAMVVCTASSALANYGPDGTSRYSSGNIELLFYAFHTTPEARSEQQPFQSRSGAVLTFDGRLDNRDELILGLSLSARATNAEVVGHAYDKWGTSSLAKLRGDWALAIWVPSTRRVILAKDFIGIRHLYYSITASDVTWSTTLDPLVSLSRRPLGLCKEYVAGWFSSFPAAELTPYEGIHAVPPSGFVIISDRKIEIRKHSEFNPEKQIRYRTDAEYEEHFRSVFSGAVRNRLQCDRPILAELSGGMDSSSIVCMADTIRRQDDQLPRVDTISYYDDTEPNWNERAYFTKVETQRGRAGCHIEVGHDDAVMLEPQGFAATPGALSSPTKTGEEFDQLIRSGQYRVLLSGTGGDEFTGGVPTPAPELEDLVRSGEVRKLANRLKVWALQKRQPWFFLLFDALKRFIPPDVLGMPEYRRPVPWLEKPFARRYRLALRGYEKRLSIGSGGSPSFQENYATLENLRRQIAAAHLSATPLYEKRYPYLDRALLEYLFAIPREQLVRPGQRRSLMRRALSGIVPDEILNRKRKAFVSRGTLVWISAQWPSLMSLTDNMITSSLGIVSSQRLIEALHQARTGVEVSTLVLLRTIGIEQWARSLTAHGIVVTPSQASSKQVSSGYARADGKISLS